MEIIHSILWSIVGVILFVLTITMIVLDGTGNINLLSKRWRVFVTLFLSHPITFAFGLWMLWTEESMSRVLILLVGFGCLLLTVYLLIRIHFFPVRKNKSGSDRYFILYGARTQLGICGWMCCMEGVTVGFLGCYFWKGNSWISSLPLFPIELGLKNLVKTTIVWDLVAIFFVFGLISVNASLRVLITSKRLRVFRRIITFLGLLIPGVNFYFIYRIYRIAKEEYATECCRYEARKTRREDDVCDTKYPIVLVHGIALRDYEYLNYWGRIPKILTERGADIYYGHQQAWDSIEDNAAHLKETIEKILEETGLEKVNIIAHSKGGLESRYLISGLHMEEKVASLTTISTPHRGSEIVELLMKLPDSARREIARLMNKGIRKVGDKDPDSYHASMQLLPSACAIFNERYKDSPKVYYQSYASVMKWAISDYIMAIPHMLLFLKTGKKSDGLVTVDSAQWGNFRGVFKNKHLRGISHADMIDFRRDDIYSFDVLEAYIEIVRELKEMGY